MATVELFKKNGSFEKDGETINTVSFYLKCGESLIPIEPRYFKDKETGVDKQFSGRKEVLKSYSAPLPAKESK